jgi:hypothetical protein
MLKVFVLILSSVSIAGKVDRVSYWSQRLLVFTITIGWIVHFV